MATKRNNTGKETPIPVGIGIAITVSMVITLIGAAITAYLIYTGNVDQESYGYVLLLIHFLSTSAGALVATHSIKRMRMQMCLIAGVCYYIVLISITALFLGGQFENMGTTAIVVLSASACVGVLGIITKKRGRGGLRKRAYR